MSVIDHAYLIHLMDTKCESGKYLRLLKEVRLWLGSPWKTFLITTSKTVQVVINYIF